MMINNITLIILFIVSFLLVHFFKMIRLYLVLLEQKVPFGRFIGIYLETTCINLIIPFKLGEIYRICRLAMETRKLVIGALTVMADRFFDIVSLLFLLLVMGGLNAGNGKITIVILGCAIFIMAFLYLSYPGVYRYLNGYLMKTRHSKRALFMLKNLELMNNWHEYIQQLVRGRSAFIIVASILGWVFEGIALWFLAQIIDVSYGIKDFTDYISAVLNNSNQTLYLRYNTLGLLALVALTVLFWIIRGLSKIGIKK